MNFEVRNISMTFRTGKRTVHALDPVNFSVSPGEFVSLIGPSGCGKSTLLSIAAGLVKPTTGQILLGGNPLRHPGRERGMVFQNYTLFPWLTVRENVRFCRELRANQDYTRTVAEILSDSAYADHLLEIMGIERFSSSYPRELSGGMKQRAAIARALANKPRILLMDEPFGALDAQTREEMQELMILLQNLEHTTTLFVTHDIEEALYLSTRVLVFSSHPGRLIEDLPVPFPPDRALDIKLEPEFIHLKRHLVHQLRSAGRAAFDRNAILARLTCEP